MERDMTYAAPLKATLRLVMKEEVEGEKKIKAVTEKEVFLGEVPLLTDLGTFVINGAERVIVSQLHRSPGVVFEENDPSQRPEALQRADHSVPRLVGRVHRRHPRRDLRAHRQEEEVPGHGAAAGVRLNDNEEILKLFYTPRKIVALRRQGRRDPPRSAGRAAGGETSSTRRPGRSSTSATRS